MAKRKENQNDLKRLIKPSNLTKRCQINDYGKNKIKQVLPIFSVLLFLVAWINLCRMHHNLHLNEAIVCSSIIVSTLFFGAADQNEKLYNE